MRFDIITIFPNMFESYFSESIIKRAQEKKLIKINIHNLRDYTTDKHKTAAPAFATLKKNNTSTANERKRCGRVDDTPYGGGAGMVLKVEPIFSAIQKLKAPARNASPACNDSISDRQAKRSDAGGQKTILLSAKGKKFDQKMARKFSKLDQIILICGRYEGVDERVAKHIADEEISIGDYVLTGGELPAMIITDAISRLIPGVIKEESLLEESFSENKEQRTQDKEQKFLKEYPQYTKPEVFKGWRVPKVLLSGNHKKM